MFFDTHAHYDDAAFEHDRDELLKQLHENGVSFIINPGCDESSSRMAAALADNYGFIYAAVGLHPEEVETLNKDTLTEIEKLASHKKCVAIGEIGLDYHWKTDNKELQKEIFIKQLSLAVKLDKPVIIHDRDAHGDCFEIVRNAGPVRGVFHCYSGSSEMAAELLKRGWYLGFDGPVTYKNAKKTIEVLEMCPLNRILIETDSPYLPPVPKRGMRNDSGNLCYIAEKIGKLKGIDTNEVARITTENAKELFNI